MLGSKPGSQSAFQFSPKVFGVVELDPIYLDKPFLYGPRFLHWGFVIQQWAFPKLLPQTWKHRIVWNVIVCCRVEISFHLN
jgi:hypothetical protein